MKQKGQALILVVVASALLISVLTTATLAAVASTKSSYRDTLAKKVYYGAEAAAEEALMRMERKNPGNSPALLALSCPGTPETYFLDSTSISISYSMPFGINAGCLVVITTQERSIIKKIQVYAQLDLYRSTKIFSYCCWTEIP